MDNTQFLEFYNSVTEHNSVTQKQLEQENILLVAKLKKYVNEFSLAQIYLHYPTDEQAKDLLFCYCVNGEGPTQLLPVLSVYASEDKIVLSYLPQNELDKLDFSSPMKSHADYMSSIRVVKYFHNERRMFSPSDSAMIFMEHIPDSIQWTSDNENYKMHQPFSFIMARSFMLWEAFYFTPHY